MDKREQIGQALSKARDDLRRAQSHLRYSYDKVRRLGLLDKSSWSEEELEMLESFASRFARSSDLAVARYLRAAALHDDPAFRGSLRDLLNVSEKSGVITSTSAWYRIRELRNIAAHDYANEDLAALYGELAQLTPVILALADST